MHKYSDKLNLNFRSAVEQVFSNRAFMSDDNAIINQFK